VSVNPSILAYAIYGHIPRSVIQRVNPGLGRILLIIEQYTFETYIRDTCGGHRH